MKIVFILNSLTNGGKELLTASIANYLSNKHDVSILSLSNNDNTLLSYLNSKIVTEKLSFPLDAFSNTRKALFSFFQIIKSLFSFFQIRKPDIIISNNNYYSLFYTAFANVIRLNRSIFFQVFHEENHNKGMKNKIIRKVENVFLIMNKATIISVSELMLTLNTHVYKFCTHVLIQNGVDTCFFNSETVYNNTHNIKYIIVGRIDTNKNQHTMIEIWKMMPFNHHLYIAGDGQNIDVLREQIKKDQLAGKVFLLGNLDKTELKEIIDQCDIGIVPSKSESFCLSMFELMSMGKPVMVNDIPVFRSLLVNNYNAVFFDVNNPKDFVEKARLFEKESFYMSLARNGKELSNQYDLTHVFRKYEKLINEN